MKDMQRIFELKKRRNFFVILLPARRGKFLHLFAENRLQLALASHGAVFGKHLSKICLAQNGWKL